MAREKIGDDVMKVRFPDGTFTRIDAIAPNRSEWIRDIVIGALDACDDVGTSSPMTREQAMDPDPLLAALPMKVAEGEEYKFEPRTKLPPIDHIEEGPSKETGGDLRPDAVVLLGALRKKRMSSRDAEEAMGWLGLRYSKAERQLIGLGLVHQENGLLVAEGAEC
ncbi:hypothetical protein MACH17_18500 [Phaeobacter inhibens]|uniref:hypothetical protein n=1 Tax=Phaeobacter inhibens TaxID=221822 RepID=UPI00275CE33C|nr:hypothetical protein [Phaeobacter inhibens]GLO70333.1 hypothetical protein MACH17_18500 [Phaeobacter inhibens]